MSAAALAWPTCATRSRHDLDSGSDSDRAFAYQFIAGVRYPVSYNIDLGLKYRLLRGARSSIMTSSFGEAETKFKSHSLLASVIYNFGAPPVILPPPPPPPAAACDADVPRRVGDPGDRGLPAPARRRRRRPNRRPSAAKPVA